MHRCGLPLCEECGQEVTSHRQECDLLAHNNKVFSVRSAQEAARTYPLVTILRLLLSGRAGQLESHAAARAGTPIWLYVEATVVPVLCQLRHVHEGAPRQRPPRRVHVTCGLQPEAVINKACFQASRYDGRK